MGGFECADHINRSGDRVNLMMETEHDQRVSDDFDLLNDLNIKVVREGVCWSRVEVAPYTFDFSSLLPFFTAAKKLNFQIIWDLCHFGYPDGLIPTHPQFVSRFTALCGAFANFHAQHSDARLMVVPINEISFLSWHSGDVRGTVPFAINSGDDIKYHLCKASIEGIKMLKETHPECMIMGIDPLIKIHPADTTIDIATLEDINNNQFTALDILLGKKSPELGGSPELLDMIGFNYYYNNQWDTLNQPLHWPTAKGLMTPFSELLLMAYRRYQKPLVLTETGHFGLGRDIWIEEITEECLKAINLGVDLRGICIYPVIDRPDWDDLTDYSKCGIWDLDFDKNRIPDMGYVKSCQKSIQMVENHLAGIRSSTS
ncbi:MAG: hypothetical protein ACSHXF_15040 [Aquaticitalea sp.]